MKKVMTENGIEIEVSIETPIKIVDGINYLLSPKDEADILLRKAEWDSGEQERVMSKIVRKRASEYPGPRAEASILWHYLNWMKTNRPQDFVTLPAKVMKWHGDCDKVKINNPK